MPERKNTNGIKPYLIEIRDQLIIYLWKKGINHTDITTIVSGKVKINRSRVSQIIRESNQRSSQ